MTQPTPKLKQPNYWQPNPKQDKWAYIFLIVFVIIIAIGFNYGWITF